MDLLELTQERYCWTGLSADRKEGAIELLLDRLVAAGAAPAHARAELLEAVMLRERRLSTGLECGVAIPHGTTPLVSREVAGVGVFPSGVPFGALDQDSTKIVILLLTPADARERHVTNLAKIARQLVSPEVRCAITSATSPEEVFAVIRGRP